MLVRQTFNSHSLFETASWGQSVLDSSASVGTYSNGPVTLTTEYSDLQPIPQGGPAPDDLPSNHSDNVLQRLLRRRALLRQ